MKDYLGELLTWARNKLGNLFGFASAAAGEVHASIAARDVTRVKAALTQMRARIKESREFLDALDGFCDDVDLKIADNRLDLLEAGELAKNFQHVLDEGEDIFTGNDEDKPSIPESTS